MPVDDYVRTRDCEAVSKRIFSKLESIEQRLFKDNGTLSIQTRFDRHEQVIRVVLWALSVMGGVFLSALALGVVVVLRAVMAG